MTLKVWNAGEQILHADLNTNFAEIATNTSAIQTNTTAIASNTAAIEAIPSMLATATRNPAVAIQDMGGFRVTNAGQATSATDLARLDQLGVTRLVADVGQVAGANAVSFALPPNVWKFRLDYLLQSPAGSGVLYLQVSTDGGGTYDNGLHYAYSTYDTGVGSFLSGTSTYVPLDNKTGLRWSEGYVEIQGIVTNTGSFKNTTSGAETGGAWSYISGGVTNILIANNSGTFAGGSARLSGWKS